MRLTDFMTGMGRIIAFHPGLKKITHSTTSTLLLSQLIYWMDKTKDGWIWKTSDEIEEETGLTYNEQKTAKENLAELGFIEYEFKRLSHSSRYRVNQNAINKAWEEETGEKPKVQVKEAVKEEKPVEVAKQETTEKPVQERVTRAVIKGDMMDGILASSKIASKKADKMEEIKAKIEKRLHINADNKKWLAFIEFAQFREVKFKESLDIFLDYAIREGFSAIYWTPEKMKTLWPQAFIEEETITIDDSFVEKLPEHKEEVYAPMPKELMRKKDVC